MASHNRRTFLKASGGLISGLAVCTTVAAAERTDRFIVDRNGNGDPGRAALEIVYDLSQIGYLVVEGRKTEAKKLGTVAPDIELRQNPLQATETAPTVESSATDEPFYPLQWDKQVQEIPTVHGITQGEGSRVAIIDSGVDAQHPDLDHAVNIPLSQNFTDDPYGAGKPAGGDHGTHVAGIVAANDDNERGVVGSAPETEIVDCRVFSREPGASFADILAAMLYAAEIDADAANISLGAYAPRQSYAEKYGQFYGSVLNSAMTYVNKEGTLLVISAGNDSSDLQHDKQFIDLPAEGTQACVVSATGPIGFKWGEEGVRKPSVTPAKYTNYGTNAVTVGAPGGNYDSSAIGTGVPWYYDLVLSSISMPVFEDGKYQRAVPTYGWKAGTSMSAPQVTGAAALVASVASDSSANQIESVLKQTANSVEGYDKTYYGSGFVDPLGAVRDVS
jgi:subtilisin family serine protease